MSRFCGKCGSKLSENGLCPNCDSAEISAQNAQNKKSDPVQKQRLDNVPKNQNVNGYSKQPNNRNGNNTNIDNTYFEFPKKLTRQEKKAKKKADKKAQKAAKKASRTTGQKIKRFFIKLIAIILAILIIFSAVAGVLVYFDVVDVPFVSHVMDVFGIKKKNYAETSSDDTANNNYSTEESYMVTLPDADEYFQNNSKVISEIEANDSNKVTTEKETFDILSNREFKDYPITTEYSMNGEYYDAVEISDASSSKHPIYQTYYVNSNGDIWTIYVINDAVLANPVTYNLQSERQAQLVISESDSVTSYDSTTNKFYESIPNESELIVKKVSRIDADTLDKLTLGGIEKL